MPAPTSSNPDPAQPQGLQQSLTSAGRAELVASLRDDVSAGLNQLLARMETLMDCARENQMVELANDLSKFQLVAQNYYGLLTAQSQPPTPRASPASRRASPHLLSDTELRRRRRKGATGSILVIDDNAKYRALLAELLRTQGHEVSEAETGENGLFLAQTKQLDLVLLDIVLPGMNGFEVLAHLKADIALRNLPVILLSGLDQTEHIVKSIEMGAEDYLPKSVNPVLLEARIEACLEKKRLRDVEQGYLLQLQAEQERSERLLLNILPAAIAERLKQGETRIVNRYPEATVLFADLVGFTALTTRISPDDLVHFLNEIFSSFDRLAEQHQLEKIKTIGDAYMIVGGLPTPRPDHAEALAEMALDMQKEIVRFNVKNNTTLSIRVGVATGPVIAGIIGEKKFIYDLWGDTVNTASRMESHSQPGAIQVTEATYERLKDRYRFEKRGPISVKGKGEMNTFILTGRFVQKHTPQAIHAQWVGADPKSPPAST